MKSEIRYCIMHCIFFIYGILLMSMLHINIFKCWLLPRRISLTMLWMLLLCLSLFSFIQYASPPVFYIDILDSPTSNFVTFVEFAKAPSSLTLICLHGWCSFFRVVRMKWNMRKRAYLDAVGNTHRALLFSQKTVSMEVNTCMEVTL